MLYKAWSLSLTAVGFLVIYAVAPKFALGLFLFLAVMFTVGFIGIQLNKAKARNINTALAPLKLHGTPVLFVMFGVEAHCFYLRVDDKYFAILKGGRRGSKRFQGTYEQVEQYVTEYLIDESLLPIKKSKKKFPWRRN